MDYGLSVRTAGHAITGLPHEPATIFHGYIVRAPLPFHSADLFFSVPLFTSLVRNPVSIEEQFQSG